MWTCLPAGLTGNFSQPRRGFREIPFDLHTSGRRRFEFLAFSPASEGWLKRSERNELLGIASNNLKLKPTIHRNGLTSRVKAHKAITSRVVTSPTKSLAFHTVTCFFRFQSRNFAVFSFCDPAVSLVTRIGSFSWKSFIWLFVFVGTLSDSPQCSSVHFTSPC